MHQGLRFQGLKASIQGLDLSAEGPGEGADLVAKRARDETGFVLPKSVWTHDNEKAGRLEPSICYGPWTLLDFSLYFNLIFY